MEVSRVLFVHAVVFVLLLSPAASFGPSLLGDIARSGRVISRGATSALSSVPPGRQTLGRAITADGRILRRSGVLLMSADMDPSDESTLPTGLLEELDSAVRLNDLLLVQDFVKSGLLDPSLALHRAAGADCSNEMLDMLVSEGAELDWADNSGRTPLMCAVTRKSLSMAAALLAKGADVEMGGNSYSGRTPLMQAASSGHLQIVQLLLDGGANPNSVDRFGRSVMVQAAMMGKKDIVRRLEKFNQEGASKQRSSKSKRLMRTEVGGSEDQELKEMVEVDPDVDSKLWNSLITESKRVDGRPDLFEWKGKLLRQPEPLADGGVVIVDDQTGAIVYQGFPVLPGESRPARSSPPPSEPSGAMDTSGLRILATAARLAVSPAVAVTRLAASGVRTLGLTRGGDGARRTSRERALVEQEEARMAALSSSAAKTKAQTKAKTAEVAKASTQVKARGGEKRKTAALGGGLFKSVAEHQAEVARISEEIASRSEGKRVTLSRGAGDSHCPRSTAYKEATLQVDVSSLDGILGVEEVPGVGWQALVEPRVTMEQLVRAVLPMGLVPEVVPEFRRITVGGSVQGIAGESSSFEKGFFHDTCDTYEVVLGDGRIVLATRDNEYADLFDALPGSYGTLGILTAASVRLMRAGPYVAMDYLAFKQLGDMVSYLDLALNGEGGGGNADYVEGFGYAPGKFIVAQGSFVSEAEAKSGKMGKVQRYDKWHSPWFYRRALRRSGGRDVVPTEDYLFRHDRGSFWMASYKLPHLVGRALGWALPSHKMYKMATLLPAVFDKSEILLQDFMIPIGNVESFVEALDTNLGVWPLWFCPLKNLRNKGLIFGVPANAGHFCNVGAYGIPEKVRFDFEKDNKMMELVMLENGGRKVHYSHAYYPQELFYGQMYDGIYYAELRDKYGAEDAFPHVHEKVVTKEGGSL